MDNAKRLIEEQAAKPRAEERDILLFDSSPYAIWNAVQTHWVYSLPWCCRFFWIKIRLCAIKLSVMRYGKRRKEPFFSLFRLVEQGQRLALELMHQRRHDEIKVPYNYFYIKRLAPNESQYKHRDREFHLIISPGNYIAKEVSHQVSRSRPRSSQVNLCRVFLHSWTRDVFLRMQWFSEW